MTDQNDPYKLSEFIRESMYRTLHSNSSPETYEAMFKKNAYAKRDTEESSYTVLYSQQREAYQKLLNRMMELHIQKTEDYGPDAINLTGEVGIMVRMVDKISRLTHLTGWDFKTGTKSEVKSPNNESIDDTLMDLASYALIMLVYRQGKWGK
jgi:hypothetical protein